MRAADGARGLRAPLHDARGVPPGVEVRLRVAARPPRAEAPFETDGRFERAPAAGGALDGVLVLRANATTRFMAWLGEPHARPRAASCRGRAARGLALIERSDCRVCHDDERRTVGPSFQEIARRYPDERAEVARLARKVLLGGAGAWGERR